MHKESIVGASGGVLAIGSFRRFGAFGPVYEITGEAGSDPQIGRLLRVRVVDTGEDVDYPYTRALDDPEA